MVEEIGAEGFMTKPFSNREIVARVRKQLYVRRKRER